LQISSGVALLGHLPRLARLLALTAGLAVAGGAAAAQDGETWLRSTLSEVRNLQLQPECFDGLQARSVHVLGVADSSDILDEAGQIEILGRLSGMLSRNTRLRVTKADTFSFIAGSSVDAGPRRQREIADLIARADRADITLVVQPYRAQGGTVDAEIRLWSRGGEDGAVRCTPSFLISVPVADPRCVDAFERATAAGTATAMESFLLFFPDCPQAAQAERTITLKREAERQRACQDGFTDAVRANTEVAFSGFIEEFADCALAETAGEMLARLEADQARAEEERRRAAEDERRLAAEEEERRAAEEEERRLAAEEERRRRAVEEEARRQALLRQPAPQWQPAPTICYVHDVRPPDDWLALRSSPSTRSGSRLRKLPSGTAIEMLGDQNGNWHRVRIADGTVGWVSWARARWIRC